jgi:ketosteroid isomerase-like protein
MRIRLVFAFVVVVALAAAGRSSDSGSDSGELVDVIHDYVAAYNSGDIDAVMAVFDDDSLITGHPSAGGGRLGQESFGRSTSGISVMGVATPSLSSKR